MPAFNEEKTIAKMIDLVQQADTCGHSKEIIVVDDGSSDSTADIVRRLAGVQRNIRFVKHPMNLGKGAAVRTGSSIATGDIIIIQDADLEYDPSDYKACMLPIINGEASVVYGSRILNKDNRKHSSLAFYLGGRLLTWFFNLLYKQELTDEPTCYKCFSSRTLRRITIDSNGFEWEPEVSAKLALGGVKIHEVPISYNPRSVSDGKKINWLDGITAIWTMFRYRYMR